MLDREDLVDAVNVAMLQAADDPKDKAKEKAFQEAEWALEDFDAENAEAEDQPNP